MLNKIVLSDIVIVLTRLFLCRYHTGNIFFTLNGRYLGVAFHGAHGTLYPTVGFDCPWEIQVTPQRTLAMTAR